MDSPENNERRFAAVLARDRERRIAEAVALLREFTEHLGTGFSEATIRGWVEARYPTGRRT